MTPLPGAGWTEEQFSRVYPRQQSAASVALALCVKAGRVPGIFQHRAFPFFLGKIRTIYILHYRPQFYIAYSNHTKSRQCWQLAAQQPAARCKKCEAN